MFFCFCRGLLCKPARDVICRGLLCKPARALQVGVYYVSQLGRNLRDPNKNSGLPLFEVALWTVVNDGHMSNGGSK